MRAHRKGVFFGFRNGSHVRAVQDKTAQSDFKTAPDRQGAAGGEATTGQDQDALAGLQRQGTAKSVRQISAPGMGQGAMAAGQQGF